ncbi:MAG: dephospho-CoA kinase [Chitinophagaceae bacterium]
MLKIGLTGGIGSGKSTVAKIFQVLGIPVFDADSIAKNIMNEDEELKKKLVWHFGAETYSDGVLNRKYLASIVFADNHQLEILNSLVHPATIQAAKNWMDSQTSPYTVKEAALLFESGTAGDLDMIVGVYSPLHMRLQRVAARDASNIEDVKKRMRNQINETLKMKLCDVVLYNDEQQLLVPQVLELHKKLLNLANEQNDVYV